MLDTRVFRKKKSLASSAIFSYHVTRWCGSCGLSFTGELLSLLFADARCCAAVADDMTPFGRNLDSCVLCWHVSLPVNFTFLFLPTLNFHLQFNFPLHACFQVVHSASHHAMCILMFRLCSFLFLLAPTHFIEVVLVICVWQADVTTS